MNSDRLGVRASPEFSISGLLESLERDAVVIFQVGRSLRNASPFKIGRAGAGQPVDFADPQGNKPAVRQSSNADGRVDPVFDEIDDMVRKYQPDIHLG